jgi:hypothetical protein
MRSPDRDAARSRLVGIVELLADEGGAWTANAFGLQAVWDLHEALRREGQKGVVESLYLFCI